MELNDAIRGRRSVRVFSDKHVEEEKIEKIIDSARWAPSACNQQLWNFIVIRSEKIKKRLASDAAANTLVIKAPVVIAVTYGKENLKDYYVSQSASAAVQNMLLSAYELGLGSCWMVGTGSEKRIKEILNIPKDQFLVCFVILGYPKHESVFVPKRKPVSEIIHNERFSAKSERYLTSHDPERWSLSQIKRYCDITSVKTEPGSSMDIANPLEKKLIRRIMRRLGQGKAIDLFSYDGTFLDCISNEDITCVDLSENTMRYSQAAAGDRKIRSVMYDEIVDRNDRPGKTGLKNEFDICSLLFKLERFGEKERRRIIQTCSLSLKKGGKAAVVFRSRSSLYWLIYKMMIWVLGDDIKKTALYSFFGPYKPLSKKEVEGIIRQEGLLIKSNKSYFLLPPVIEDLFQLMIQYYRSEKTNFVHRMWNNNIASRAIRKVLGWQGLAQSRIGACTVIIAEKSGAKKEPR